jgi:hypothetical protein
MTRRLRQAASLAILLFMGSCGGGGGAGGGDGPLPFTTLISRSWTIPANTDTFKCTVFPAPTDLYITGFREIAPAGQYRMLLTVSDSATTIFDFDCNAGTGTTPGSAGPFHLIYAAGMGTDDFSFPPGVGVHVKAGQFLNLNLYVINTSQTSALSGVSGVMIQAASAAQVATEADMFLAGTTQISVPSDGQTHTEAGGCTPSASWNMIAFWPSMNALGQRQTVTLTRNAGLPNESTETLHDARYSLTQQVYYPSAPVPLLPGNRLETVCYYVNSTGATVTFSDQAAGEACFTGIYRTPAQPPGDPTLECVDH